MSDKLTVFGTPEDGAVEQIEQVLLDDRAVKGALMADNHKGYSMPIGGVVAYEDAISPTGVGFDIACGNMAVKTDLLFSDLGYRVDQATEVVQATWLKPIMREIQNKIAFGIGRSSAERVEHKLFEDPLWKDISDAFGPDLYRKAQDQLGTVGSGNHYVDLLVDTGGHIWVANHFGSRGLGHTLASGFMAKAAGLDFTDRIPESEEAVVFSTKEGLGQFYIEAMNLAGDYAYAGREYVIGQVLEILGAEAVESVHNHHNFAWFENGLWVVRKGATPLTREPAFIGGSMGDVSVIVRGALDSWDQPVTGSLRPRVYDIGNLGSAPHGAGRVMSRTAAAGKVRKMWVCQNRKCGWVSRAEAGNGRRYINDGQVIELRDCPSCGEAKFKKVRMRDASTAAIDWNAERQKLNERGIIVLGAGADESPGVYKDLGTVLAAHPNIEILESLRPIGVVMAGADEHDPYKD